MDFDLLKNKHFDGFSFVKYGFSFCFSHGDGNFEVSTNYNISTNLNDYKNTIYMNENIFLDLYNILENKVRELRWLEEDNVLLIDFGDGKNIIIWAEIDRVDNLAIWKNTVSDEWGVIG